MYSKWMTTKLILMMMMMMMMMFKVEVVEEGMPIAMARPSTQAKFHNNKS